MVVTEITLAGHHGRHTIALPEDAQILSVQWKPGAYHASLWVLAHPTAKTETATVEMVHTWHRMPPGRYKHLGSVTDHVGQMCHYFLVAD